MDEKPTAAPPALAKNDPIVPDVVDKDGQPSFSHAALDAAFTRAKKLSADDLVSKHLTEVAEMKPEDHPEVHRLVSEHVEEAQLSTWQRRALLARFHAHGLHIHSRVHPDVFKAALDEALHGRI